MTAGTGFIGLAVLILGKWRPFPILFAALLFGLSSAVADRLGDAGLSPDLLRTIPYVVTPGRPGRVHRPGHARRRRTGVPYIRGGR